MAGDPGSLLLAYLAGVLSTLSPCVLPLIPILLASAAATHRLGPYALAAGLALSFAGVGLFVATLGVSLGLDQATFRNGAAVLLIGFALVLLSGRLQERFAAAASGLSGAGANLLSRLALEGLAGQLVLGLLLGVVWSPCVGPTLGAALTLASQGQDLGRVALAMILFGLGAGTPLVAIGLLSRQALARLRGRLLAAGRFGRTLLGMAMLVLGILILTGADKRFEAWFLEVAPAWLSGMAIAI
jgi:cytochrome c biogenesis protein CcdA